MSIAIPHPHEVRDIAALNDWLKSVPLPQMNFFKIDVPSDGCSIEFKQSIALHDKQKDLAQRKTHAELLIGSMAHWLSGVFSVSPNGIAWIVRPELAERFEGSHTVLLLGYMRLWILG